jgi:protein-disulfide isomerase
MNRKIVATAGVLIPTVFLIGCGTSEVAVDPVEFEGMDDPQTVVGLADGVVLGSEDAPITIAEFGDYQCPGCGAFAATVKPQIDLAYLQTGQAQFVFYDFPLITIHPHAFLASRAARCALDQDRFWEYHDALFRNQSVWSRSQPAPLGLFEDYGGEVGLEPAAFRACLRSDQHAITVTANLQLGILLGVTGTPTVLVSEGDGGFQRLPDNSFAGIRSVVDGMLGAAGGEVGSQ